MTVAYLNNPFRGELFDAVVEKLLASYDRRPRSLRLIYKTPLEEARLLGTGRVRLVRAEAGTSVVREDVDPDVRHRSRSHWLPGSTRGHGETDRGVVGAGRAQPLPERMKSSRLVDLRRVCRVRPFPNAFACRLSVPVSPPGRSNTRAATQRSVVAPLLLAAGRGRGRRPRTTRRPPRPGGPQRAPAQTQPVRPRALVRDARSADLARTTPSSRRSTRCECARCRRPRRARADPRRPCRSRWRSRAGRVYATRNARPRRASGSIRARARPRDARSPRSFI